MTNNILFVVTSDNSDLDLQQFFCQNLVAVMTHFRLNFLFHQRVSFRWILRNHHLHSICTYSKMHVGFGFFGFFWRTWVLFLWGHWYPCFGLLVTSPLGFKARVGSALFELSGGVLNKRKILTMQIVIFCFFLNENMARDWTGGVRLSLRCRICCRRR